MKKIITVFLVLTVFALTNCSTTREELLEKREKNIADTNYKEVSLDDLKRSIASVSQDGQGFIVKAYVQSIDRYSAKEGYENSLVRFSKEPAKLKLVKDIDKCINISEIKFEFEKAEDFIELVLFHDKNIRNRNEIQIEPHGQYTFHIAVINKIETSYKRICCIGWDAFSEGGTFPLVTKIDEIRSAKVAWEAIKAEEEAERKRILEESKKHYKSNRMTIIPDGFLPYGYEKIDSFDAMTGKGYGSLVADVVFVSQEGTSIVFKTFDGIATQIMEISARSGLTYGQRVRVYYTKDYDLYRQIYRWHVNAIERL